MVIVLPIISVISSMSDLVNASANT
jgi:hypothetical protein